MPNNTITPAMEEMLESNPSLMLDAFEEPVDDAYAEIRFCREVCTPGYCWCACEGGPVLSDPTDRFQLSDEEWDQFMLSRAYTELHEIEPNSYFDEEYLPVDMIYGVSFI